MLLALDSQLATYIGVVTCTLATTHLHLVGYVTVGQGLFIGVTCHEVDTLDTHRLHVVDSITSGTSDTRNHNLRGEVEVEIRDIVAGNGNHKLIEAHIIVCAHISFVV